MAERYFSPLVVFLIVLFGLPGTTRAQDGQFSDFEKKVWQLVYIEQDKSLSEIYTELNKIKQKPSLSPEQQALLLMQQCRLAGRLALALEPLLLQAKTLEQTHQYAQGAAARFRCEQEVSLLVEDYKKYAELGHLTFLSLNQFDLPALRIWLAYDYIEQALEAGLYDKAISAAEISLTVAQANQLTDWQAETLGRLALIQSAIGNHEQALATNQQAMALSSEPKIQLELSVNRAYILTEAQQYPAARRLYEDTLAESLPDYPNFYLIAATNLIGIYITQHDFTALSELVPTLSALAVTQKAVYLQAYIDIALAADALINNKPAEALEIFARGKSWFEENQVFEPLAQILNRWALLLHSNGLEREAFAALQQSIALGETINIAKRTENALLNNAMLSAEQQKRELLYVKQQHLQDQALLTQKKLEQKLTLTVLLATLLLSLISFYAYWRLNRANKQLAEKNTQLDYESTHDPLTKVFNRRYFSEFITPKIRSEAEALLLLVDIDHFKKVNDTYGHHAGDEVLKIISQRLANRLRASDCIIRWGGEEFLLYIDNPVNEQQCAQIIKRLLQEVAATPVTLAHQEISITISIGFSIVKLCSLAELEQQLNTIDGSLYQAKNNGRNRAVGHWQQGGAMDVLLNTN